MNNETPFTLREDFTYLQLETFGELMISLPNICRRKEAEDVSSAEIINLIARLAIDFEAEWSKMSAEDHDAAGEDWLEEIDKLANWILKHLYDVLHNELEYGYKVEWLVVEEAPDNTFLPSEDFKTTYVDANDDDDAIAKMTTLAFDRAKELASDESVTGGSLGAETGISVYRTQKSDGIATLEVMYAGGGPLKTLRRFTINKRSVHVM